MIDVLEVLVGQPQHAPVCEAVTTVAEEGEEREVCKGGGSWWKRRGEEDV